MGTTATVAVTGGEADGSTLRLEVVRQGGQWKLDYLARVQIDRERFDAAQRRELTALATPRGEAECAVRRVRRIFPTPQIERALVSGKTRIFAAAEVTCFRRSTLAHQFTIAVRHAAPKDVPAPILDCVIRKIIGTTSTAELRVLFAAPDRFTGYFEDLARSAARSCAKESESGLLPEPSSS